jgi:hypothetical protein
VGSLLQNVVVAAMISDLMVYLLMPVTVRRLWKWLVRWGSPDREQARSHNVLMRRERACSQSPGFGLVRTFPGAAHQP